MTKVQDIPLGLRRILDRDLLYKVDEIIRRGNLTLSADEVFGTDDQIVVTINADNTITLSISDDYLPGTILGSASITVTDNGDGTVTLMLTGLYSIDTETVTSDTTLTNDMHTVLVDASNGGFTIIHPTAVGVEGKDYEFKRVDNTKKKVVITGVNDEEFDGDTSFNFNKYRAVIGTRSDNENWILY